MIHLEIVGSSASPRSTLLHNRLEVDNRCCNYGSIVSGGLSPIGIVPPSSPVSRRDAIRRVPSSFSVKINKRHSLQKSNQPLGNIQLSYSANIEVTEDIPCAYANSVQKAISSYIALPSDGSGCSSPIEAGPQNMPSLAHGGWTTGNNSDQISLHSSCYSLDEFDRRAISTVNRHFEEFESILYEGHHAASTSVNDECQEWTSCFPYLRVLGRQILRPSENGFDFISPVSNFDDLSSSNIGVAVHQPVILANAEHKPWENCSAVSAENHGLAIMGHCMCLVPSTIPNESKWLKLEQCAVGEQADQDDFMHEEILAQHGVFEEVIAMDCRSHHEERVGHHQEEEVMSKRRPLSFPPFTAHVCIKDRVCSVVFDTVWCEIPSLLGDLIKHRISQMKMKKVVSDSVPYKTHESSFVINYQQVSHSAAAAVVAEQALFDGMLNVSRINLRDRHLIVADVDVTDLGVVLAQTTLMPVQSISANRPSTVNQRRIKGQSRRLEPLQEPATLGESLRTGPLHVKQIVPAGAHLLCPPNRLPPLESSSLVVRQKLSGSRVSSAMDNKESRVPCLGSREKSSNAIDASHASTMSAMWPEVTSLNRHQPAPHNAAYRQASFVDRYHFGVTGSRLRHPSANLTCLTSDTVEDSEVLPVDELRHNQWIPSTPSFLNSFKSRRMRISRNS